MYQFSQLNELRQIVKPRRLIFKTLVHYIMIKKEGRQGRVTLIGDKKRGRLRADPDLNLYIRIYLGAYYVTLLFTFSPLFNITLRLVEYPFFIAMRYTSVIRISLQSFTICLLVSG